MKCPKCGHEFEDEVEDNSRGGKRLPSPADMGAAGAVRMGIYDA